MKNSAWGGRFQQSLDPRVNAFNASLFFDHVLYAYDITGSKAHANMLARQGLITHDEALKINHALSEIKNEIDQGMHTLHADCEDVHMWIEQLLIKKIGDTGKKLHTGRSRNDQVALDLRLYTRDHAQLWMEKLSVLIQVIKTLSVKHEHDKMPGYTHLQQAQPIFLGQYFSAYVSMFERDLDRLDDWKKRMNVSPLGAGALAGSGLPLDREFAAKTLQFNGIIENTLDAVSDRDFIIELLSIASLIMMHLSRLCEDLIIWATQEFGFITLSDAFSTGSSLMPNKKNPDVLELIRGKSGRVFGHLTALLTLMKGLPMSYNKDMQEDKEALFDTVKTVSQCLEILSPFLEHTQFNTEIMEEKAHSGFLHATSMLESLVLKGVAFRDAHHQVGEWVKEALKTNQPLHSIMKKKIIHVLTGQEVNTEEVMQLASKIKKNPDAFQSALKNKNLALIFDKPSFRTRLSFMRAIQTLGGNVIESTGNTRKTEEPRDLIRVLNPYCDAVMVRTHDDDELHEMAAHAQVPIINGLTALRHPCQVFADLLTLNETFGTVSNLTLAYIGDGNNILHSLLELAPSLGIRIHYCCPQGHAPHPDILKTAMQMHGNQIVRFTDPIQAVQHADAVYTDVWVSMGFEESNHLSFEGFQVNESLMKHAKKHAVFMHCMPMERGKEVSCTLPDSEQSVIFKQSENRLHVQKALLVMVN